MKHHIIVSLITLAVISTSPHSILAQDMSQNDVYSQPIETQELKGEVLKINNNLLTIQTDEGVREVAISENMQITRNTMNAEVADLEPGDDITLTQAATGEVLGIESTSQTAQDAAKTVIPAVIVLALGTLAAIYLAKRANRNFIKTDTANLH